MRDICWSPETGRFVIVGDHEIHYSVDGSYWYVCVAPNITFYTVCWSPRLNQFLTVGNDGIGGSFVYVSADGYTWSQNTITTISELGIPVAFTASDSSRVKWIPTLRCYLMGSTPNSYYSIDGITWYTLSSSINIFCAAWSDDSGVLVVGGGGLLYGP